MSYSPTTWTTGDKITASALNHMEQGIAGAGGAFPVTEDEETLDKTWNEIATAIASGQIVYIYGAGYEDDTLMGAGCNIVRTVLNDDGTYYVYILGQDDSTGYSTSSASGYPTFFD